MRNAKLETNVEKDSPATMEQFDNGAMNLSINHLSFDYYFITVSMIFGLNTDNEKSLPACIDVISSV